MELLKRFKEKKERKSALDKEVKEINQELEALKERILEMFLTSGVDSIKVDGKTISSYKQIWAKIDPTNKVKAREILKSMGLEDSLVTLNHQALSAYIREFVQEGNDLPKEFDGVIGFHEVENVRLTG